MPASLYPNPSSSDRQTCAKGLCAKPSAACIERSGKSITIGLVNNMPDGALEATERQFLSLLDSASDGISVRLALYSLPGVPRNESGASHIGKFYSSVEDLWDAQLDGLIVTGREPLTVNLADEPYWENFTRLLEWAEDNTHSTIWSCLAAHAATLYMDGISRVKNDHKHSGVFNCARLSDHPLIAEIPARFQLPHSRWNGLPEDELIGCGYRVLTRTAGAGVDTFIKHCRSMFVFFQGHPEYEPNTLLLEYRRDVARFLRGETNIYPLIPRGYFDGDIANALMNLEEEARSFRQESLLTKLSEILAQKCIENTWYPTAVCIYKSWLKYISAQKKLRLQRGRAAKDAFGVNPMLPAPSAVIGAPPSTPFTTNPNRSDTVSVPFTSMLTVL